MSAGPTSGRPLARARPPRKAGPESPAGNTPGPGPQTLRGLVSTKSLANPITRKMAALEGRYYHELMSVEERCELRRRILRLKARAAGVF